MSERASDWLVRASAGTGKTYRLVQAYAELVQAGQRPSEIVAITFTRRAAGELRTRIRARLRASGASPGLLAELARAPVSNFHGLALQLLAQLGTATPYGLGTQVLGEAGEDRALFLVACAGAWFETGGALGAAVAAVASHLDLEQALPDALWTALNRAREDDQPIAAALLGDYDPQRVQAEQHAQLLLLRARLGQVTGLTGAGQAQLQVLMATPPPAATAPVEAWAAAWTRAERGLSRRSRPFAAHYTVEDQALLRAAPELVRAEALCAELVGPVGILMLQAWRRYGALKAARRAADFADLIEAVVAALTQSPAAHRALRERFRTVLVDEAQDTNALQRRLVHLLAGWTGAAASTTAPAALWVVGDWKQSIYTFRGADPDSFAQFAAEVAARGGQQELLTVSRRSQPALVAGINHLGRHLFAADYEPLAPLPEMAPLPGAGMYWQALVPPAKLRPSEPTADRGEAEATGVLETTSEAEATAACIGRRLAAGARPGDVAVLMATLTQVGSLQRALAALGIAAVVGGGSGFYDQAEVVDVLALLHWLVDGEARLHGAEALRSPLFAVDEAGLMALLHRPPAAPRVDPAADPLAALCRGELPDLAALEPPSAAALRRAAASLPALAAAAATQGAAAWLRTLEASLQLRARYAGLSNGPQRLANLDRLAALAAASDARLGPSTRQFVRQQRARMAQKQKEPLAPVDPAARAAVTLTTVHQSKGLQYPVVILPFLDRKGRHDGAAVAYGRGHGLVLRPVGAAGKALHSGRLRAAEAAAVVAAEAEKRRLLYVAMTRAEREIWFVGTVPPKQQGFGRFLHDWLATAVADGVLQQLPPAAVWLPPATAPRAAPPLPRQQVAALPAGSRLSVAVTTLASWASQQVTAEVTAEVAGQAVGQGAAPRLRSTALAAPGAPALLVGADQVGPGTAERGAAPPATRTGTRVLFAALQALAALQADPEVPPASAGGLSVKAQGILAHAVLAALERQPQHARLADFVTAELRGEGLELGRADVDEVASVVRRFLTSRLGQCLLACPPERRRHELPFRWHLAAPPYKVAVRGQIDLVYWQDDAPVVVDYKFASAGAGDLGQYLMQLDLYGCAIADLCGWSGPVRTQLVFLRDPEMPLEHWVSVERRAEVCALVQEWAAQRARMPTPWLWLDSDKTRA